MPYAHTPILPHKVYLVPVKFVVVSRAVVKGSDIFDKSCIVKVLSSKLTPI